MDESYHESLGKRVKVVRCAVSRQDRIQSE